MRQTMLLLVLLPFVVTTTAASAPSSKRKDEQHRMQSFEAIDETMSHPVHDVDVHPESRKFYGDATLGLHDGLLKPTESVIESRFRRSLDQPRLPWPVTKRRGWGKRNWEELLTDSSDVDADIAEDVFSPEIIDKRRGWGKRTVSRDYNL
jgi:hypothetical protein